MAGRAVLRMVPSRDCMKKAIATTQGIQRAVMGSSGVRSGMASSSVSTCLIAGKPAPTAPAVKLNLWEPACRR
ncbi:hypothetical protein KU43P_04580 [Pseudomonas sp. KU43P]|nr:hypothetical protein KU43P_04580 [Pseudomonas sp. KU43P]